MHSKISLIIVCIFALSCVSSVLFADVSTIEAGDRVKVTVLGCDDLKAEPIVDGDGNISLPLVGTYRIGGKSPATAAAEIRTALKKWVKDPKVNVEVSEKAKWNIVVAGQVKKGGSFTISSSTTLLDAIALAGGPETQADLSRVSFARAGASAPETIDLRGFMAGSNASGNPVLRDGDTIMVPETAASISKGVVFVLGEVKKSGMCELREGMRIHEAVSVAGGATDSADPYLCTITHENGQIAKFNLVKALSQDSEHDVILAAGDTIYIPAVSGSFNIYGSVKSPGQYPVKGSMLITDAMALAGGYSPRAKIKDVRILRASGEQSQSVNLDAIEHNKAENVAVKSGDTIVVPEKGDRPGAWQIITSLATIGWLLK